MVDKMKKNKNGFSLVEILLALSLLGFLFAMTITQISKIAPDPNKARFKKGYVDLESVIHNIIRNDALYPNDEGFKNTTQVIFKGTGETIGFDGPTSKFREAFKYEMSIVKDKIDCELYPGMTSSTGCFMAETGVVYGIPDTDFNTYGIVKDEIGNLAPIVLYTRFTEGQTVDRYAFIVGVRADGIIKILYTVDCKDTTNNEEMLQCKSVEFLKSDTIKKVD